MVLFRIVMLVVLAAVSPAAQTPFSSAITGTVRDTTGAVLQGAKVSVAAPTLIGGRQTAETDARGEHRFTLLPPGVYEVAVSADKFRPARRTGVRVASGETVTIDLDLEVAGPADELVIHGRSPVVDVTNSAVPVRLDEALLQNLPTSRTISDLLNLAPGISSDVAYGGSQKGNEVLLDGVRTTDPLFQDPVIRANYNWVQEVNVVGLGAAAEYGGFSGAAGYAVLRSGANFYSGLGEYWTTRPSWLSNNTEGLSQTLQRQFNSRELFDWLDLNGQVGGPILRDRLWFFGGVQKTRYNDKPAGYDGPGSRDERDLQVLFRPTASLSPSVRVDGFIEHGRHEVIAEALSREFPLESTNDTWNPQTAWNAHLTWTLGDATVFEARTGGYDMRSWMDPHPPGTINGPWPRVETTTGVWSQNTNWYSRQDSAVQTTTASLGHYAPDRWGQHQIKVGVEYEATSGRQEQRYPGGRNYYDYLGEPSELQVWGGTSGSASTDRWVVHAQDTWTVNSRLTLSPGVRVEWNHGDVPLEGTVFRTRTVAPRLGVALDLGANHRTVARLHLGRYYDPIFSSRIMQEDDSDKSPFLIYEFVSPDQWVEINRFPASSNFDIDPALNHSHVDQIIVGLEHELVTDVSVQAQYIRRRFDTFMGLTDTGSIYAPTQLPDPGPDGILRTADDGAMLDVFNLTNPGNQFNYYTNPDNAFNKYDAVQLVARKRYTRNWQMQGSYTWSKNRGTVGNRWHVNAARFDLGNPGRFANPNLNINAYGRASFDPTHEVKVLGGYRLPWWGGTMVSGVYRYMTGQAWGRTAIVRGFTQGQQRIRIEPQGTRRLDAINRLDLRLEKMFGIPNRGTTLGLFLDVFNVWNQGVHDSDVTNAVIDVSGPQLGEPSAWVDPRTLRLGVRVRF